MATEIKRIKNRRDTAANWTANNPVLMAGEFGVELDTHKIKVGDGVTAWNELIYCGVTEAEVEAMIADIPAQVQSDWNEADTTSPAYIANKPSIPAAQVNSDWNSVSGVSQILNKPTLATVATSGSYNDLTDKPSIPANTSDLNNDSGFITSSDIPAQVQSDWDEADTTSPAYIANKPTIPAAQVNSDWNAVSGVAQILNKPTIPAAQVNSDWNAVSGVAQILNKPTIPTNTSDLNNDSGFITSSDIPAQQQADWDQSDNTQVDFIKNKPSIPAAQVNSDWNSVSGVSQILNKPSIPANTSDLNNDSGFITINDVPAQVNADWDEADTTSPAYIANKPTIPAAQVNADWNAVSGVAQILNKPTIPQAPVQSDWNEADNTSLAYIQNKPSIPAAQVNSDWNAVSGVAQILNKPTIPTNTSDLNNDSGFITSSDIPAQQNSDWDSNSGVTEILNKPLLVTEKLTFTLQGGTTVSMNMYYDPGNYFYVENTYNFNNTLEIYGTNNASTPAIEVFKSTDRLNWESMGTTSPNIITATIPAKSRLYLKATTSTWATGVSQYNHINCTSNFNVGGNIMSLLYGDDFKDKTVLTEQYTFCSLFYGSRVKNASDLLLPATTLTNNCYRSMFQESVGDNYLLTAPKILPATTVTQYCYQDMFYFCTALTTAPVLPATTLATGCYQDMFLNCRALTTAPELPATTLKQYCYSQMFNGCTSLTTAPVLPATTLDTYCYDRMFNGCTSLTTAPALPATTLAISCYNTMFNGCTSLTSAPVLPATTLAQSCYQNMFSGSGLTSAPELPATTLANYCYSQMFYNCTSLTAAPALPATTLKTSCYQQMFNGCTLLNSVTTYANDISASNCLNNWLSGVSATGTFHNLGSATYTLDSASGIPTGWTEVNS